MPCKKKMKVFHSEKEIEKWLTEGGKKIPKPRKTRKIRRMEISGKYSLKE